MLENWQDRFPQLYDLYQRSDTRDPNNYFSLMSSHHLSDLAIDWAKRCDILLARLDAESYELLLSKAAPHVCGRNTPNGRNWYPLLDILNEARGYAYLLDHGYTSVHLIPESQKPKHRTPDVRADGPNGSAVLETKTIHHSDLDFESWGNAQSGIHFLSKLFRNKLKDTACEARQQILSYLAGRQAKGICYFVIELDFRVHHVKSNYDRLDRLLRAMSSEEFEVAYEAGPFLP
jgi:hypothetical protein